MHVRRALSLVLLTFFPLASAKPSCTPVWTNSEAVASERPDFLVQGEYRGKTHGLQIVSAEGNKFYSSRYSGELPAAVWDGSQIEHLWGDLSDTKRWITGYTRIERSNLGKTKPPPGSIILFDGSDTDEWKDGKMACSLPARLANAPSRTLPCTLSSATHSKRTSLSAIPTEVTAAFTFLGAMSSNSWIHSD